MQSIWPAWSNRNKCQSNPHEDAVQWRRKRGAGGGATVFPLLKGGGAMPPRPTHLPPTHTHTLSHQRYYRLMRNFFMNCTVVNSVVTKFCNVSSLNAKSLNAKSVGFWPVLGHSTPLAGWAGEVPLSRTLPTMTIGLTIFRPRSTSRSG